MLSRPRLTRTWATRFQPRGFASIASRSDSCPLEVEADDNPSRRQENQAPLRNFTPSVSLRPTTAPGDGLETRGTVRGSPRALFLERLRRTRSVPTRPKRSARRSFGPCPDRATSSATRRQARIPSFSGQWPRIVSPPDSSPPMRNLSGAASISAAIHLKPTGTSCVARPCKAATRSMRQEVATDRTTKAPCGCWARTARASARIAITSLAARTVPSASAIPKRSARRP